MCLLVAQGHPHKLARNPASIEPAEYINMGRMSVRTCDHGDPALMCTQVKATVLELCTHKHTSLKPTAW